VAVDLPEVHARALDVTHAFVAGIGDTQWGEESVCDGWTVRELVNHVVSGNDWAVELTAGKTIEEVGDWLDGDVLGNDPLAAYDRSASAAAAAFRAPGAMDAPCAVSYGPVPGSVYCGHRFLDVLVHGWDMAASTGQPTELPPDLVEACIEVLEPQIDMLVASGLFGTQRSVPDDADPETRLLGMLGRGDVR
jgi:uncharacterized protein (TIGR03086 family)